MTHIVEAGNVCVEPGCIQQLLVQHVMSVHMSAMVPNQQSPAEDQTGQGQSNSHNPILAEHTLVPYDHSHVS